MAFIYLIQQAECSSFFVLFLWDRILRRNVGMKIIIYY